MVIALLFAAAAAQPSPEALRLGRELARHGTLAALLPIMKTQQVEEIVKDAKGLTPVEQQQLRQAADRVFESGQKRLLDATGAEYAKSLSVQDLRLILRFYRTPAAAHLQAATPRAIIGTMQSAGQMDFKSDVRKAFCSQTGKLCGK
ncbi:MAG: DUF2059 domain-containing protein [Pseudomonadota bacterium]